MNLSDVIIIIFKLSFFTFILIHADDEIVKKTSPSSSPSPSLSSISSSHSGNLSPHKDADSLWNCEQLDYCSDRLGFEAIRWLHRQLDDDANGNIDIAESDEFLRDELHYENGYERQKVFHGNDKHISVDELWNSWKQSSVRNWTVDETIEWLVTCIELPQYVEHFQTNAIDGMALPRLAANTQFLSTLGITNAIHKQKIALKAMDVVLFGAHKRHNYVKDILLVFSLVIAIGGCWFAYVQHKYSQTHLKKMMRDMDSLQKAEEQLMGLQQELDKARQEQESVAMEKVNLEKKLRENENQIERSLSYTGLNEFARLEQLEDELRQTREELRRAEAALSSKSWSAPQQLQHWLQLTHELEIRNYNAKKNSAEMQLYAAKDACEKLRKKRSTLLGAFRVAHGNSIDDVDSRIIQAKSSLSEVTKDLQERLHRWKHIESFCQFPIVHNPGFSKLESILYGTHNGNNSGIGLTRTASDGTITDEDGMPLSTGSIANYPLSGGGGSMRPSGIASAYDRASMFSLNLTGIASPHQKQSIMTQSSVMTSSSIQSSAAPDTVTDDEYDDEFIEDMSLSGKSSAFTIGDVPSRDSPIKSHVSNSGQFKRGIMTKSFSQDHDSNANSKTHDPKICHSESCSELQQSAFTTNSIQQRSNSDSVTNRIVEDDKTSQIIKGSSYIPKVIDEETASISTDSSSIKDESTKEKKRSFFNIRKRKNAKT